MINQKDVVKLITQTWKETISKVVQLARQEVTSDLKDIFSNATDSEGEYTYIRLSINPSSQGML